MGGTGVVVGAGGVEGGGGDGGSERGGGPGAFLIVGAFWARPPVWVALQAAVLITEVVLENGSEAYSVWVVSSMLPTLTLACGCAIGIVATGAQPDRSPGWQGTPLITSIWCTVRLSA